MFGSAILEIAIGLGFVFLIFSLLVSAINELILSLLNQRGRMLWLAIRTMLDDRGQKEGIQLSSLFKINPLFKKHIKAGRYFGIMPRIRKNPSYLSAKEFTRILLYTLNKIQVGILNYSLLTQKINQVSLDENNKKELLNLIEAAKKKYDEKISEVNNDEKIQEQQKFLADLKRKINELKNENEKSQLLDTLQKVTQDWNCLTSGKNNERITPESIRKHINHLPDSDTKDFLLSTLNEVGNHLEKFKAEIENWFDSMMDRATGWYKRRILWISLILGFVLSAAFNVNTIEIAKKLRDDPEARAKIVDSAIAYHRTLTDSTQTKSTSSREDTLEIKEIRKKIESLIDEQITPASTVLGMGWDVYYKKHTVFTINDSTIANLKEFNISDSIFTALSNTRLKDKPIKGETKFLSRLENYLGRHAVAQYSALILEYTNKDIDGDEWWKYASVNIWGWLISAFAISFGAPFWFDLLGKLINLRGAGKKPQSSTQSTTGAVG